MQSWCRENVAHGGKGMSFNNLLRQNGFWIINVNIVVRSMIYRCINSYKLCGNPGVQKTAKLPKIRCLEVPPFTQCGVNMLGLSQGSK